MGGSCNSCHRGVHEALGKPRHAYCSVWLAKRWASWELALAPYGLGPRHCRKPIPYRCGENMFGEPARDDRVLLQPTFSTPAFREEDGAMEADGQMDRRTDV